MGGDQARRAVAGPMSRKRRRRVRRAHDALYLGVLANVRIFAGARTARDLRDAGHEVGAGQLGLSGEVEHYLDLLGGRGLVSAVTTPRRRAHHKRSPT